MAATISLAPAGRVAGAARARTGAAESYRCGGRRAGGMGAPAHACSSLALGAPVRAATSSNARKLELGRPSASLESTATCSRIGSASCRLVLGDRNGSPRPTRSGPVASASASARAGAGAGAGADGRGLRSLAEPVARLLLCVLVGLLLATSLPLASRPGFATLSMAAGAANTEGMMATARSAWGGLAAGCLHTLAGPDHLAALAPLTIGRSRGASAALGALWGGGHSTGQLLIGLVFVMFKEQVQHLVPVLSRCGGVLVGITLIAIGIVGFKESEELGKAAEAGETEVIEGLEGNNRRFGLATYATGIIYGLQPDALFVVIPALALPTKVAAAAFVSTFVLGTVLAMSSYTAFIGVTSEALGARIPWVTQRLSQIAAGIATVVGLLVLLAGVGVPVPFVS